jgi:transposase
MSTTLETRSGKVVAVAIEIASAKWVVASFAGERVRRKVLSAEDAPGRFEALLAEVREVRRRWAVSEGDRVVVGYEAGSEGFWLVRALRSRGVEAEVIDPASLPVERRARRAKTDRLDADALVRALWRFGMGDGGALRMVRVPSLADEDAREWQRARDRLADATRSGVDRIRKKLRTQGIWELPAHWRVLLREGKLRGFDGEALRPQLQAALVLELDRLELAESRLREWDRDLSRLAPEVQERIERLAQVRGIGERGSRALALGLYWRDFDNRRQVGASLGLVGTPYDSGTMRQDQGISKAGPPRLRALLIELSWLWLRLQPMSEITRWYRARTEGSGARGRRVMIVAVARKLAIALWRYLKYGEIPAGAVLKQPLAA